MDNYSDSSGFLGFLHELPIGIFIFGGFIIILVVGIFGWVIIRGIAAWSSNNQAELVDIACKVVGKRMEVWGGSGDSSASTEYFVTFEFADGSRKELCVKPTVYGLIIEGDHGAIQYQGTRFINFSRS